jgi:predicted TIM-barrel fold metal-dependent hydrolase
VSFEAHELEAEAMTFDEMRPGVFDVAARLADMDLDGVEASVCFPNNVVRFCGQRFLDAADRELGLVCVQAYNDFLVEEWNAPSGGRLSGAGVIPLWDVTLAAEEVRHNSARGLTSVCFSEIPARLGLPSMYSGYWDPFFAACEETHTVINLHIGSSSQVFSTSADAPGGVRVANHFHNSAFSLSDWLVSGAFVRFPGLQIAFSEGQAGWLPYLLGRLDDLWHGGAPVIGFNRIPEPPSHYIAGHVYACIFDDLSAVALAHQHGRDDVFQVSFDNLMFETDYPHNDSTWPRSRERARRLTAGLDAQQREKVLRRNAATLYRVDRVLAGQPASR